ncbi:MAG TPA: hypothetical protein PKH09_02145 [Parvularculaceae bacterium]|nr:hypothetical protein [Parvularculaceae bacterium]
MQTKTERLAQRLTAISTAKAVIAPPTPSQTSGRTEMIERQSPRRSVFRQGILLIPGGGDQPCMILDWSDCGARIRLDGVAGLPEFLTLKLMPTGTLKRARLVWRLANTAGLSFLMERKTAFGNGRP